MCCLYLLLLLKVCSNYLCSWWPQSVCWIANGVVLFWFCTSSACLYVFIHPLQQDWYLHCLCSIASWNLICFHAVLALVSCCKGLPYWHLLKVHSWCDLHDMHFLFTVLCCWCSIMSSYCCYLITRHLPISTKWYLPSDAYLLLLFLVAHSLSILIRSCCLQHVLSGCYLTSDCYDDVSSNCLWLLSQLPLLAKLACLLTCRIGFWLNSEGLQNLE